MFPTIHLAYMYHYNNIRHGLHSFPRSFKDGCVFFAGKMKELCQRCCQRDGYNEI